MGNKKKKHKELSLRFKVEKPDDETLKVSTKFKSISEICKLDEKINNYCLSNNLEVKDSFTLLGSFEKNWLLKTKTI